MVFLLVLAVVLFLLGLFTVKVLWWAALVLAAISSTRSSRAVGSVLGKSQGRSPAPR